MIKDQSCLSTRRNQTYICRQLQYDGGNNVPLPKMSINSLIVDSLKMFESIRRDTVFDIKK